MIILKQYKGFLLGLIVGAVLMIPTGLFAASALQKVEVYLNPDIKLQLNGKDVTFQNTPLNYNGYNYLPIGELSDLVGLDAGWDDQSRTITLNQKLAVQEPTEITAPEMITIPDYISADGYTSPGLKIGDDIYISLDAGNAAYKLHGYEWKESSIVFNDTDIEVFIDPENGRTRPIDTINPGDGFIAGAYPYIKESIFVKAQQELKN